MLNDQFLEEVATKRNQGMQTVMYVIATVIMVLSMFMAAIYFNLVVRLIAAGGFTTDLIIPLVITLVSAGVAVLLFLKRDTIKTEYEYTFTNGILDFAQVFNNKKRKALGTMNLKNIEACGKVNSGSFNRYISMPGIKRINWFVNREADLFYLYFTKDSQKKIIIIEPSEEMEKLISRAVQPGVYQKN